MNLLELDSRRPFGTDMERPRYADFPTDADFCAVYPRKETVRVIVGELGRVVRMSAPSLDIVVEGSDRGQAWTRFLEEIRKRGDSAWLRFDVGPTRREEIEKGLDIPEDEDWSVLFGRAKD